MKALRLTGYAEMRYSVRFIYDFIYSQIRVEKSFRT